MILAEGSDTVTIPPPNEKESGSVFRLGLQKTWSDELLPKSVWPYLHDYRTSPFKQSPSIETTTDRRDLAEYVQDGLVRLHRFSNLPPDWDSYGAQRISLQAIRLGVQLLITAAQMFGNSVGDRVRPYAVAPLVFGGVQLEWRGPGGELEVEIGPEGDLSYLLVKRQDGREIFEEGDDVSWDEVLDLITTVLLP